MLLIMIPGQYPNYYKALEIYTGYFHSLDTSNILLPYPSSIVITRDYCMLRYVWKLKLQLYDSSAKALPFIKRGVYTHQTGRRKGEPYKLQDILQVCLLC